MNIYTQKHSFNSDLHTAVGVYMSLRNSRRKPVLLEGNDYHSRADSSSFIGFDPLIEILVYTTFIELSINGQSSRIELSEKKKATITLEEIIASIQFNNPEISGNGFYSYFGFEYAHIEETTCEVHESELDLPLAHLILYSHLIIFDHFRDSGKILINSLSEECKTPEYFKDLLSRKGFSFLPFEPQGEEQSSVSAQEFLTLVEKAKEHILRGDVFQLVVSRPFSQSFFGDDFEVYRQLRRLNPSPYLFYADMESYRLMGSSPETQIQLRKGKASIHPIAGTVRKTGDKTEDARLTDMLIGDEKENAEHTMLVDLARNDLSKYCSNVKVESYKEIQQFSHVIHLVSKITGEISEERPLELFAGTFPAGTLSGTPKPKALQLIQQYEKNTRDYYGGAIGFLGTDGSINLAIVIRSMLSKNNKLHYRAGAGVVYDSVPENELQEVNNKLGAVRKAISNAAVKELIK